MYVIIVCFYLVLGMKSIFNGKLTMFLFSFSQEREFERRFEIDADFLPEVRYGYVVIRLTKCIVFETNCQGLFT